MAPHAKLARILVIAGSDSGGGAGIQADIKTITALGAYASTAITALTVQNTQGVSAVHLAPVSIVAGQIEAVLSDIGADAIKIGMLGNGDIARIVAHALNAQAKSIPIVLDPVMIAKGGASLLDEDAVGVLKTLLIPQSAVVTPNAPEAEALTGLRVESADDLAAAAMALIAMGARAALVKGGHLPGGIVADALVAEGKVHMFRDERIAGTSTHGTGCTLASGIAAGLGQGLALYDAVARARDFVREAIRSAPGIGNGHGPLNHLHALRPYGG
jgi:hydroxymethylpyrimidine/phosphomethylpyrimidine kinase